MAEICVVHLVRRSNGPEPFERFLDSYKRHPAGAPHELAIVFKGFYFGRGTEDYISLLRDMPYRKMYVWDFGFDIGSYMQAVRTLDYSYFCFLNSYSVILCEDWLRKMSAQLSRRNVGLVGATGSCESAYSVNLQAHESAPPGDPLPGALIRPLRLKVLQACFDPFPNCHIRTNAFIVSREVIRAVRARPILTKLDALRFESGKDSLSRQVMRMGLQILVVGKDGQAYERDDWFGSNTFRSGDQGNLLVADNQTVGYQQGDPETRSFLSRCAWGEGAGTGAGYQVPPANERA